ncbi:hypothetical protein BD410DRAFT_789179 [Rickenella mellea]|uniref:F-box domain-containing protein n=1 Tax=Rickenella mellea TaxID=50990 RepID=A0A4Y7Q2C2_9AGAM|nr:hypothetical protein BD410DRAFT_789179 [Rickenella mellea]
MPSESVSEVCEIKGCPGPAPSIHRLPPEVLSGIFIQCLPKHCLPKPHSLEAPLFLCQICSFLRSVAVSTPQLWAAISMIRNYERDGHREMLDLWIQRSGSHPLSFSLMYRGEESDIDQLVDILVPHAWRWKDVLVAFPTDSVSHAFREAIEVGTCHLRALTVESIHCLRSQYRGRQSQMPLEISLAHQLTEMSINVELELNFGTSVLNSVKRLSFYDPEAHVGFNYVLYCLEHCPAVENLTVKVSCNHLELPQTLNIRTFPSLRHLDVSSITGRPHQFFGTLCLPNLHTLTCHWQIDSYHIFHNSHADCIVKFLQRSQASLRNLSLTGARIDHIHLMTILRHTPQLKAFICDYSGGITIDVVSIALTLTPSNQLCLGLENVTMLGYGDESNSSPLRKMISSRWNIPKSGLRTGLGLGDRHHLKMVNIEDSRLTRILREPSMEKCVNDGLDIHFLPESGRIRDHWDALDGGDQYARQRTFIDA